MKPTEMKSDKSMEKRVQDPGAGKIRHTPDGAEDHSDTGGPMAVALRVQHRDNLGERVREMIKSERLALEALREGYETFEESDDFDVDDDTYDPQTPYEEIFEGSVSEDMESRKKEQEEALRNIQEDKLKLLLGNVDPEKLDKVLASMGKLGGSKDKSPAGS